MHDTAHIILHGIQQHGFVGQMDRKLLLQHDAVEHNLQLRLRRDGVDFSMPLLLGYTGLSDNTLRQYIQDSQSLWQGQVSDLDCVQLSSVVGTHAGPGAVAVAYFKSGEVK